MTLVEARWDDARRELRSVVRPLTSKSLPVAACDGLVLAADVTAHCSLPSFDTSAMDGWAVAGPGPWTLVGESLAGRPAPMRLASGECVRIATGATVPAGATGVVRSEAGTPDTTTDPITLAAPVPETGSHVRPRGEECRTGEVLAPAGSALNPAALGLAAAAGNDVLSVVPRPRVTVLMFGDELVNTGLPRHGMVRDSLGPQLPGWLARLDVDVVGVATCEDTLLAHVDAIQRARADALNH